MTQKFLGTNLVLDASLIFKKELENVHSFFFKVLFFGLTFLMETVKAFL